MKKTLIAVAVAALSLPAAAVFHERMWLDNLSYFDDTSGITWMDGLRANEPYEDWNRSTYGGVWQNAPSLEQLQSLNRSRQESDPFVHLLFVGPPGIGGLRNDMWTSTQVPCLASHNNPNPAFCQQVPVGAPFDYMVPLVYHFGPDDGYWHPYQDDWPLKLSLRFAVGDVGTPITSAVPEPGTWALMLAGLAVVTSISRRQRWAK